MFVDRALVDGIPFAWRQEEVYATVHEHQCGRHNAAGRSDKGAWWVCLVSFVSVLFVFVFGVMPVVESPS